MNPKNENDERTAVIITTTTSTFILYSFILTIVSFIDFYIFEIFDLIIPNKMLVIMYMGVIGILNYRFFIKDKKFLNYNFKIDKKGGYAIIGFIAILALLFVLIANKNREKIFKERERIRIENKR
jgi:amino acid transporter